jgi:TfoX/Sxy family transcriptional regulator of competence genes
MSYYQAPPEAMDNADKLGPWAQKAYEAAMRGAQNRPKKKGVKK